jgi:hypothetical protein
VRLVVGDENVAEPARVRHGQIRAAMLPR